jgi:hypothetical protein
MNYAWYDLEGADSVLADFAYSDWDPKHLERRSDAHIVTIEPGAMRKVAFASGNALPWFTTNEPLADGRVSAPMASLPFYWNLINNTKTYRVYEQFVQDGLSRNVAHLHTGDDYFNFHPILPGDTIATTVELKVLYEKQGRAGPMKFIEDVWSFRNQHNVLAGQLVRKAVTIYYNKERKPAEPQQAPELSSLVPKDRITSLEPQAWRHPKPVDVFDGKPRGYSQDIGPISWTMMVQWMGAVDDYARTHYDFDYAIERGFPGETPIVAGPHMGALMIAPVLALAGRDAWIEEFRHIQRHQINPKERMSTFGVTAPVPGDRNRVQVTSWLVDDKGRTRNSGTFVLRRWDNPPSGSESRRWAVAKG